LGVSKTKDVSIPAANKPSARHATAGVPCCDALSSLCEMEVRLAAHNALSGGRADEHRTSIKISHETPWSA